MKTKWTKQDWNLISAGNKLNRSEWKQFDDLIKQTTNKDVKRILRSMKSTFRMAYEFLDVLKLQNNLK
jgi:hypothetical protein